MHQTVNYSLIKDEAERKKKALADIKFWLGQKKFMKTTNDVKACQPPMSLAQFYFMCEIGGIQGYPTEVWAEHCGIAPAVPSEQEPQEIKS